MTFVTYFLWRNAKKRGKLHHQLMIGGIFTVGTLAASFLVIRWELLSAMMMFFASQLHVQCRRSSRNAMAFIFTGVGIGMACWFVTGLLGITLAQLLMIRHEMWESMKQGMLFMMANTLPDLQFT
ncbi:hypothetical protein NVIRENTERO_03493 [Sodalis praecaptivus]|nr:hypothetical protein NVIRENTERO_03493 [Sodalis praecaptivus]